MNAQAWQSSIKELRIHLKRALSGPLPAAAAHQLMAPRPRPGWDPEATAPEGRPAAVLAVMYPVDGRPTLLLTKRTDSLEFHRGQVAFPGGAIEEGESVEEAALRETEEEMGFKVAPSSILGRLSPLWIPATGYTATPVVATLEARPAFAPDAREVERTIEVALSALIEPGAVRTDAHSADGWWREVRHFPVDGDRLWGATAMMTAELLVLLGWGGPETR